MENKLEQLLNTLIQRGWKPFGIEGIVKVDMSREHYGIDFENSRGYALASEISPRQLTSKESGLWQFVCENKLINQDKDNIKKWTHQSRRYIYGEDCWIENNNLYNDDYEYYIIESSLKNESELEQFLLDNIKVDE